MIWEGTVQLIDLVVEALRLSELIRDEAIGTVGLALSY